MAGMDKTVSCHRAGCCDAIGIFAGRQERPWMEIYLPSPGKKLVHNGTALVRWAVEGLHQHLRSRRGPVIGRRRPFSCEEGTDAPLPHSGAAKPLRPLKVRGQAQR